MKFIGVDLHKQTITVCVMGKVNGKRKVLERKRFLCVEPDTIREFFEEVGRFQVVVEATSSYEWFLLLVEDLADRWVLAHPKKLRIIAESKHKSDKIDARILAEFLMIDMLPEAYRPSPRVRQHRVLMRHRRWVQGRITSIKCKLRHKLAHYNADIAHLFTRRGQKHLAEVAMDMADRFTRLLVMNTAIPIGEPISDGFLRWKMFAATVPEIPTGGLIVSDAGTAANLFDAVAYDAPFPDNRYKAGVKRFPAIVPIEPGMEGVEHGLRARKFFSNDWSGESFMAIGMRDPVLGETVMEELRSLIRGCPEPMKLEEAGHFVQEYGEPIARRALEHFGIG